MSDEMQALCFLAGANSIFYGEKLLTTGNPGHRKRPGAVRPARHPSRDRCPRELRAVAALPEFGAVLADLDERGLRRQRRSVRRLSHDTAEIELDGKGCIDFCSNDYLGLSAHPRVALALIEAAREHGVGARASHLISRSPARARRARGSARRIDRARARPAVLDRLHGESRPRDRARAQGGAGRRRRAQPRLADRRGTDRARASSPGTRTATPPRSTESSPRMRRAPSWC